MILKNDPKVDYLNLKQDDLKTMICCNNNGITQTTEINMPRLDIKLKIKTQTVLNTDNDKVHNDVNIGLDK
ncbi:MAG: hypothetical protein HGB12_02950 [Bacteroidetes bacterium]|nr:hypothetical protein [Bacteroidota bacterium]